MMVKWSIYVVFYLNKITEIGANHMKNKQYSLYNVPEFINLKDFVEYCGTEFSGRTAFRYLEKKTEVAKSYKAFKEDVAALGTYFIAKGYNRTHIAVIGENSYKWIVTYFAVVNSNNVIVPLDKEASVDDLKYLVEKSDTSVIVHSDDYTEEAEASGCSNLVNMKDLDNIIAEGKALIVNGDKSYENTVIDENAMCTLVYTSGTTSEPKGVMLSHLNIVFDTVTTSKSVLIPDSALVMLPIHHTYGFVASITIPMLIGSSIFINSSMRNLMSDINYAKPKYIACVPMVADAFYKKVQENLKSTGKAELINKLVKVSRALCKCGIDIRRKLFKKIIDAFGGNLEILVIGGAQVNENTVIGFHDFGVNVLCGYGITECSPIVSTVRNKHYEPKSVGVVHPGVEVRIKDGEIQVKGNIVFSGYYKNEEATREAFDGEWFKTGDLGTYENDMLYINGRIKNLIILPNGKNVSPEELEQKIMDYAGEINEVIVYEKDGLITAEIYYAEADEVMKKETEKKIFEFNKNLPTYKQIGNVVFRDTEFPKTTTKKIKRR